MAINCYCSFFSQILFFQFNSFNINKKKEIYIYIYKIYNRQIDDHMSKDYTKQEKKRKLYRSLYNDLVYTEKKINY
jgi:hypothetical protein